jgi:hypothetical protein
MSPFGINTNLIPIELVISLGGWACKFEAKVSRIIPEVTIKVES